MNARKEYLQCINGLEEAKMMMNESDPEMKEMAREEAAACEARIPELEEEITGRGNQTSASSCRPSGRPQCDS